MPRSDGRGSEHGFRFCDFNIDIIRSLYRRAVGSSAGNPILPFLFIYFLFFLFFNFFLFFSLFFWFERKS